MDGYGEEDDDVHEAYRWMQRMGMGSFAKATMWLQREVFGMPEEWMICDADADEGRVNKVKSIAKAVRQFCAYLFWPQVNHRK